LDIIEDAYFNAFILLVIIANTVTLSLDKYPGYDEFGTTILEIFSNCFTFIFTLELIVKMIGLGVKKFF
jgi:hypothetical protein